MKKIVIFGASGDLANRKLIPSLSKLKDQDFVVSGFARSDLSHDFHGHLKKYNDYSDDFLARLKYVKGDYAKIAEVIDDFSENVVFYLSVPPELYLGLIKQIVQNGGRNIVIEKPFAVNRENILEMKSLIAENETVNLYLIDHYLYKPMTCALNEYFSTNQLLVELIRGENVKNINVLFKESIGAEGRVYFDKYGMVRDVVENHMAEIIGVIITKNQISRLDLFSKMRILDIDEIILGQYEGYKEEFENESNTESFCMIPLVIDTVEWRKVPIFIIAGKALDKKECEIKLEIECSAFGKTLKMLSLDDIKEESIDHMYLTINYSPRCEIFIEFHIGNTLKEKVLCDKKSVDDLMAKNYGSYVDYCIVFDALLNDKKLSFVELGESIELLRIFEPVSKLKKKKEFYKKGTEVEKVFSRNFEGIKKKMENLKD